MIAHGVIFYMASGVIISYCMGPEKAPPTRARKKISQSALQATRHTYLFSPELFRTAKSNERTHG
jgi:hypothetical protein